MHWSTRLTLRIFIFLSLHFILHLFRFILSFHCRLFSKSSLPLTHLHRIWIQLQIINGVLACLTRSANFPSPNHPAFCSHWLNLLKAIISFFARLPICHSSLPPCGWQLYLRYRSWPFSLLQGISPPVLTLQVKVAASLSSNLFTMSLFVFFWVFLPTYFIFIFISLFLTYIM